MQANVPYNLSRSTANSRVNERSNEDLIRTIRLQSRTWSVRWRHKGYNQKFNNTKNTCYLTAYQLIKFRNKPFCGNLFVKNNFVQIQVSSSNNNKNPLIVLIINRHNGKTQVYLHWMSVNILMYHWQTVLVGCPLAYINAGLKWAMTAKQFEILKD